MASNMLPHNMPVTFGPGVIGQEAHEENARRQQLDAVRFGPGVLQNEANPPRNAAAQRAAAEQLAATLEGEPPKPIGHLPGQLNPDDAGTRTAPLEPVPAVEPERSPTIAEAAAQLETQRTIDLEKERRREEIRANAARAASATEQREQQQAERVTLSIEELTKALETTTAGLDGFFEAEVNRPGGPRKGALRVLIAAEERREGGPRPDVLDIMQARLAPPTPV